MLGAGLYGATAVDGTGATVRGSRTRSSPRRSGRWPALTGSALDLGAYGFPRAGTGERRMAVLPGRGSTARRGHIPTAARETEAAPPPDGSTGPGEVTGSCSSTAGGLPVLAVAAAVLLLARRRSVNSRS